MEERSSSVPLEAPQAVHDAAGGPGSLGDPRTLQILTTEHWSLLSARSLVYNEAFSRGGMYLSFLSATVVALGLIATATGFTDSFLVITAVLLGIDLFIGYASLGRIASTSSEDIRFLQAMNRIRHAYVDIAPGVAPYFMTGHNDDPPSVLGLYGPVEATTVSSLLHGFTTMPGMIGTINSAVGGALGAVVTMLLTRDPLLAGLVGVVGFLVLFIGLVALTQRMIHAFWSRLEVRFPTDRPRP